MSELRDIFSDLVRFETELWNSIDERLRVEHDITLARVEIMHTIASRGTCRVNDIAADLSITVGGTSKIVDRLESSQLCRRRANPEDRRSSLIELTPTGGRLMVQAGHTVDAELARRFGTVLPARTLTQFATTLTTLRTALRASYDDKDQIR